MVYAVVIPDGMADYPLRELGGRTPLEAACTPNMDRLARRGTVGLVKNVPDGMPAGSDVAIMSVLGYDPARYHTGRAPLEAPDLGVELGADDVAFRMNLVTVADGRMADYAAGHITTEEAGALVAALAESLGEQPFRYYRGVSYRHLAVTTDRRLLEVACTPPHDITGREIADYLPVGRGADVLLAIMEKAAKVLVRHEVNTVRRDLGENPANAVWFWGQGTRPTLPAFERLHGCRAGLISAVSLLRSLAAYGGIRRIDVPSITGYYDTNYRGKGEVALAALGELDLVIVHVEAPDEAGHNADVEAKVRAIERVDADIVGVLMDGLAHRPARLLVLADHPTPIAVRSHTAEPAPFVMAGSGVAACGVSAFAESSCRAAGRLVSPGHRLMDILLSAGNVPAEPPADRFQA